MKHDVEPAKSPQLAFIDSRKVPPLATQPIALAIRQICPDKNGQRIRHGTPPLFTDPQSVFGAFSFRDIHIHADDSHGFAHFIFEHVRSGFQPVNASVRPDDSKLRKIFSGLQGPTQILVSLW